MRERISKFVVLCCLFILCPLSANAFSINGTKFDQILSGTIGGSVGIWYKEQKGYTFGTGPNFHEVDISNLTISDNDLKTTNAPSKFSMMFMTAQRGFGTLTSNDIVIKDSTGNTLLSLSLAGSGTVSGVAAKGTRGEANFTGLFNIVGGSWFTSGLLNGPIYAAINYSTGLIANSKDFHATGGSFEFYSSGGGTPPDPIPEPATMLLLGLGAIGGAFRRTRSC